MPRDLGAAVSTHKALVEQVRAMFLSEDEESLADTIEGLTTVDEAIFAVLRAAQEREAMALALRETIVKNMVARARRFEETAASMRLACLHAIHECGLKTPLRGPDFTVSVGVGKPKVIVKDEALLPDHLCRVKQREPDKVAIGKALAAGQEVPGVELGNPMPSLSIHKG